MTTGPDHYREAERLLDAAMQHPYRDGATEITLAAAQVHATLAQVAAAAEASESTMFLDHSAAWGRAIG